MKSGGVVGEARACLGLAGPLVAGQLASVAMGVTDTMFMGRLGVDAVAAGGLAVAIFSAVVVAAGGLVTPVSPLVAQANALGRSDDMRRTVRAGLVVSFGAALLCGGLVLIAAALLPRLGQPASTIAPTRAFLFALAPSLPAALAFHVLRHALVGRLRPRVVLVVTLVGVGLNVVLDYTLGFGAFGAPRLGLTGLGVATSLATWAMLACASLFAHRYGLLDRRAVDHAEVVRILRLGTPVAVMFGLEAALFAVATFVVGRWGIASLAAHQIVLQTTYAAYMVPQGISQAAAVRVARAAAAHDRHGVRLAAWTAVFLGAAFMAVAATTYVACPRTLASLLVRLPPSETGIGAQVVSLFAVAAVYQVFDGAQVVAAGALRGLHDTSTPMRVTVAAYGLVGIPSAVVLGRFLGATGAWWGIVAGLGLAGSMLLGRLYARTRDAGTI